MCTCGRNKAEAEPAHPARDPHDVETIKRLQQQIQELELQQLQPDSPEKEAKTEPNFWDDEPVDVNPFVGKNIEVINEFNKLRMRCDVVEEEEQVVAREFAGVIPDDITPGLQAMRDIQYCIDFIPGSAIPNRPAYRMNPKEFAELQKQATGLLKKGLIQESMSLCAIPALLYYDDPDFREIWSKCDNVPFQQFSKLDGYLFKGARLCIPLCSLREAIILEGHAGGLTGHFRRDKNLALLREQFYWLKIERDINMLFERYPTCHIAKTHSSNAGFYTPLSVRVALWEDVSLDFVLGFPRTHEVVFAEIVKLHGVPKTLTSNQDVKIDLIIPQAEFAYNRSVNRTTGKIPFEVVYGRNLITPMDLVHVPEVLYREGNLVWIHLRKERFSVVRFGKLKPRGDGPFRVLKKINDNAYKIELPAYFNVSVTFNVADLLPYKGDSDDEPDSWSSLFQEGEDDADAVNERVNVTNTLGAYFAAINFCRLG
nr:hypothetical protein [Tanacetum cinerariifolium]